MLLRRSLGFACVISVLAFAATAAAQQTENRRSVEAVLSRTLLERGAMVACAQNNKDKDAVDLLSSNWKKDIADTEKLLRESGYAEDYVRTLGGRYTLDTGVPKFSDIAAATKFCAMLGDWKTRYFQFHFLIPDIEIKRVLRR